MLIKFNVLKAVRAVSLALQTGKYTRYLYMDAYKVYSTVDLRWIPGYWLILFLCIIKSSFHGQFDITCPDR